MSGEALAERGTRHVCAEPPEEYAALRRYLRAAIAIASSQSATDEHAEALAEAIIHLAAVRATLRPPALWCAAREDEGLLIRARAAAAGAMPAVRACVDCDDDIPAPRIEAAPATVRCLPCQALHDHRRGR